LVGAALLSGCAALSGCGGEDAQSTKKTVDPTSREAARADRGAIAIKNRKCAQCHTETLGGAASAIGSTAMGVELYPPNLTNHDNGIRLWTDDQLATAIRTGYDRDGMQLCPQMKHDSTMTDYEVFSIVLYLRSLPPQPTKVPRSVCPPLKSKEEQTR
jgi:mono/diheme cytochrome c family protein